MQFTQDDLLDISKMLAASEFANIEIKTDKWEVKISRDAQFHGGASKSENLNTGLVADKAAVMDEEVKETNIHASADSSAVISTPHESDNTFLVRSPILGTFYESPQPGAAAFVKEGDTVEVGDTLCLLEVMKTYTDVVASKKGRIRKVLIQNGDLVESDQVLFVIEQF